MSKRKSAVLAVILSSLWLFGFAGKPTIVFSHAKHAGTLHLACSECHQSPPGQSLPSMPKMDQCASCHETVHAPKEASSCMQCHSDESFKIVTSRQLRNPDHWDGISRNFKHQPHANSGVECTVCHTKILKSARSSDNNYPTRADCGQCHEVYSGGPQYCVKCHGPPP